MNVWSQPNSVDILMPAKKTNLLFLTSLRSLSISRLSRRLVHIPGYVSKEICSVAHCFWQNERYIKCNNNKKNAMKINFQYIMFDYIFPFFKKNQQYWCLVVVRSNKNAISYEISILIKVGWYICWDKTQPRKKETLLKESKDQGSWRQL